MKYNHCIIKHKNIFNNYNKISLLLNSIKTLKLPNKIPKYILFEIIYLICI